MAQIFDKKNESFVEINFGLSKVDEETNIIEFNKKKVIFFLLKYIYNDWI